jgi:hypothetical protein
MNANIVQIPALYDRGEPESVECSLRELKSDEAALIERFIDGQSDAAEHRQLVAFLLRNPAWISWIASRINENFESSHQNVPKGYFMRNAA